MSNCSYPGCLKTKIIAKKLNLCNHHYYKHRAEHNPKKCTHPGCSVGVYAKGLCHSHRAALTRKELEFNNPVKCIVVDCIRGSIKQGFCTKHYQVYRLEQNPKARYGNVKSIAKKRGLTFELTFEEWDNLQRLSCDYCNLSPTSRHGVGLDRLDNSKGYLISNVVPCCNSCNSIRGDKLSPGEMKVAMKAVIAYRTSLT